MTTGQVKSCTVNASPALSKLCLTGRITWCILEFETDNNPCLLQVTLDRGLFEQGCAQGGCALPTPSVLPRGITPAHTFAGFDNPRHLRAPHLGHVEADDATPERWHGCEPGYHPPLQRWVELFLLSAAGRALVTFATACVHRSLEVCRRLRGYGTGQVWQSCVFPQQGVTCSALYRHLSTRRWQVSVRWSTNGRSLCCLPASEHGSTHLLEPCQHARHHWRRCPHRLGVARVPHRTPAFRFVGPNEYHGRWPGRQ